MLIPWLLSLSSSSCSGMIRTYDTNVWYERTYVVAGERRLLGGEALLLVAHLALHDLVVDHVLVAVLLPLAKAGGVVDPTKRDLSETKQVFYWVQNNTKTHSSKSVWANWSIGVPTAASRPAQERLLLYIAPTGVKWPKEFWGWPHIEKLYGENTRLL